MIVPPPEFRSLGSLPADQFVPELMKRLELPYYAGLLTAAEYGAAAHQRPQEFQVFLEQKRRPIIYGMVRVRFIVRKCLRDVPGFQYVAGNVARFNPGGNGIGSCRLPAFRPEVSTML